MKNLRIRELLSFLIGVGIVVLALYSFAGYHYLKKETQEATDFASLNRAFYVSKEMAGLYDRITDAYAKYEDEMYDSLKTAQEYFRLHGRDASLERLKKELIKGREEILYEVFQINDQFVIDRTTYPNDLGLDFKQWPTPYNLLKEIYTESGKIDLSLIIHSASQVEMRRFIVQRAEAGDYLIQLGLTLNRDYLQQETIISLQRKIPTLLHTRVYQVFSSYKAPKEVERWWMMEIHEKNGNPQIIQDDVTNEFTQLINPMLDKPMTFTSRAARQKYFVELFEKKSYLDSYYYKDDVYIHRVVMPLSTRFSLYNESISLIVMEFDESEAHHELMLLNLMTALLWLLLLLLVVSAIWLVYKRIMTPLAQLEEKMKSHNRMPFSEYRDEVSNIGRTYNQLLDDLHSEIYANRVLLEEFKLFASNAIHQIRTPLSVIKIALEMAECRNKEAEKQIASSLVTIEHMYDTLSYTVQHEKVEYAPKKINLSRMVEKRIALFQVVADAHDIRFDAVIEPERYVDMNPQEAEYLIDNNLSNAIKYSEAGSVVSLFLRLSQDELSLSFWNFGDEIRDINAIFKRHVREDDRRRGSGIGLHIVETICKKNNILIQVDYVNGQNQFTYYIEVAS